MTVNRKPGFNVPANKEDYLRMVKPLAVFNVRFYAMLVLCHCGQTFANSVLEIQPYEFLTGHRVAAIERVQGHTRADGMLVAAVSSPLNQVFLMAPKNGHDYTWPPDHIIDLPATPLGLAVGDYSGDGLLDVAVATRRMLWLFYGASGFRNQGPHISGFANSRQGRHPGLSAVKLNPNASSMDFITGPVLRRWSGGRSIRNAYFWGPVTNNNGGATVADLDLDGFLDVVFMVPDEHKLRLYYGPFPEQRIHPHLINNYLELRAPQAVTMAQVSDMNGDGRPDIVTNGRYHGDALHGIHLYLQNTPVDFTDGAGPSRSIQGGTDPVSFALADLNDNGMQDLLVLERGRRKSRLLVILQQESGEWPSSIESADQILNLNYPASGIWVLDFDGRGLADVAVAVSDNESDRLLIFRNILEAHNLPELKN